MEKFDPKLKTAAEEIKAILLKHEIGGTVSLASPTHGEFIIHAPAWAGMEMLPQGGVRIKFTKEEQSKAEGAAHFVVSTLQITEMFQNNFFRIFEALKSKALISMTPVEDRITPHDPSMVPTQEPV